MTLNDLKKKYGIGAQAAETKPKSTGLDQLRKKYGISSTTDIVEEAKAKPRLYKNEAEYYAKNDYSQGRTKYDEIVAQANAETERLKSEKDAIGSEVFKGSRKGTQYTDWLKDKDQRTEAKQAEIDRANAKKTEWDEFYGEGSLYGYNELAKNEDFEQNSRAKVPDYISKGLSGLELMASEDYGKADTVYNYINNIGNTREAVNEAKDPTSTFGKYDNMTDDERKLYTYIHNTKGAEDANNYLKKLGLEQRGFEKAQAADEQFAKDKPVTAWLISRINNGYLTAQAGADLIMQTIKKLATGEDINYYSTAQAMHAGKGTFDAAVAEKAQEAVPITIAGIDMTKLAVSALSSGIDSMAFSVLPGGAGAIALAVDAGISGMRTAAQNGATDGQALLKGVSSAVFEYLFERVSLGNFKAMQETGISGWKDVFKNITKSMGVNMTEEMATEAANIAYDMLLGYDYSEIQGASGRDLLKQVVEAGLSGMLMGIGFGAAGNISSGVQFQQFKNQWTEEMKQQLVDNGVAEEDAEKSAKLLFEMAMEEQKQSEAQGETDAANADFAKPQTDENAERMVNDTAEEKAADIERKDAYSEMVSNYADSMDAAGQNVFIEAYDGSVEPDVYVKEMQDAYDAGRRGEELAASETVIGDDRRQLAYKAGEADKATADADYGFVHNEVSHTVDKKLVQNLNRIGKDLKVKIQFVDSVRGGAAQGSYRNGVVTISRRADDPYMVVAKHEITHHLEKVAPKAYAAYQAYAVETVAKGYGKTVDALVQDRIAVAARQGDRLTEAEARAEIAADFTEMIFADEKTLRDFVEANSKSAEGRNMLQRLWDAIRRFIASLKKTKVSIDAEAARKLELDGVIDRLEQAEMLLREALKEGGQQRSGVSGKTDGTKYSFAGKNAKTANYAKLDEAIKLEDVGQATSEEIRQRTGWFRGYDGKWRFEISDRDMEFNRKGFFTNPDVVRYRELADKFVESPETMTATEESEMRLLSKNLKGVKKYPKTLGDYVKHDRLFEAYPQLKDIRIRFEHLSDGKLGAYIEDQNEIVLNYNMIENKSKLETTLIHEIQHAVQSVEGFATGSNPAYYNDISGGMTAYQQYFNTAGEIEARDAERRMWRSEDALLESRPDIDRTDVVFADAISDNGKNVSIKQAMTEYGFEEPSKETRNNLKLQGVEVIDSKKVLVERIEAAVNGIERQKQFTLGAISNDTKAKIEADTQQKLFKDRQYSFIVDSDDFVHISKHFSDSEKIADEVVRLFDVIAHYDNVKFEQAGNQKTLIFNKKYSHADIRSVEVVSNNRNSLNLVTVFYTKKNKSQSNPAAISNDSDSPRWGSTLTTNIPQPDPSVKSQNSTKGGGLDALRKQYGEIEPGEHPFREAHIPKRTEKKKYVSQTVRTAYEAKATPDYILPEIEQLIETGAFSFEKYSDEAAYNRAKTKIEGGYTDAYNEWFADVRGAKVSKDITALGWALYDYALTKENKVEDALKILTAMAANVRLGAQAVQAVGILKKLTPEGKLAVAQQMASKINDDIRKRESTPKQRRKIEQDAEELSEDITEARKTAARNISRKLKGGANKGAADYKQRAPFVFEYAQTVGEAVAATISKEKKEAERTTISIITSQLTKFAREKMPKAKGASKTDILLDLVNNYEFYRDAYEFAKNEIQRVYGDDERFAEFLKSPVYGSSLVLKEVAQTALDIGETAKLIREKDALGMDIWDVADAVGDKLIEKTGATGNAASMLREAAYGYVFDILKTKTKNDAQMVDEIVRGTLRDIGVRISDFVAKSDDAKDNLKDVVTSLLVRKYNIPADRAAQAADIIGKQFEQMVKTEAEATLKRKFEEKKYQNPKEKKRRKTISEMITELAYLGAFDMGSPFNRTATMKVFESKDTIEIDPVLAERLVKAKTERAREEALQDIYRDIGRQTPSNWRDKWNAWRYLAMLGNPRTHVRNIAGNALFAPIVGAKNMAATGIEALVYKATGGKIKRTKAMPTKELLKAAWDDFDTVSDKVLEGEKYNDRANANKYIKEGRQIYKNKMLEGARRKNSELLDKEDEWFLKPHYAFALAQYCKANNITPEMLKAEKGSDKIKADSARAYAAVEAQKATYRDANAVSDLFGRIGKYEGDNAAAKAVSTAVDAVLPFRKTPANILVRAVEYSPVGLIKSLSIDFARVDKGAISPAQQIDNIAAGLTGTALMGLGFVLGKLGKVIGMNGDEEDERKFNELQGYQGYAWRGENRTYTLDWLAPEAMPFFVGVNLAETKALEEMDMAAAIESLMNITAPMLEMSCLQGLNDLIDSASSVTGKGVSALAKMAANAATSYLTQGLPTIFGQVERITESTRQATYTDKNNKVLTGDMQYTLGKAFNKLPGDVAQIPYIDAWGRETSTGNVGARAFNNLLNPGYSAKIRTSPMEKELQRLYDATGEASVLPDRPQKYITVKGTKIELNKNQYVKYAKVRGQTAYDMLTKITENKQYAALDEQSKVDLISKVYSYANEIAKAEVTSTQSDKNLRYQLGGWEAEAAATSKATGIPVWKYVLIYNGQPRKGVEDEKGETIPLSPSLVLMEYLYGFIGLSDAQRQALYADFDVAKSVRHYDRQRVAQELKKMRAK